MKAFTPTLEAGDPQSAPANFTPEAEANLIYPRTLPGMLTLAGIIGGLGLCWTLGPVLPPPLVLMIFVLLSILSTSQAGLGPGILTLFLGILTNEWLLAGDASAFKAYRSIFREELLAYVVVSLVTVGLAERLRRTKSRAARCLALAERRGSQLLERMVQSEAAEGGSRESATEKILRLNRQLETRVRERTAALETANRELEAFSYTVSHDLRAPLRSIHGFTRAVLEDCRERLDAHSLAHLQYACDASQQMNSLIEDLLKLSRVSRAELLRQEVDLSALAAAVAADLRRREPQRKVEFRIESHLSVQGDESLLRIVLENLLGNAWKFTGKQPFPVIEFGTVIRDGTRFFFVRDNGAGFSLKHAQRLFEVFQRLHSTEEFPGTGIGLATVKRILLRHGGNIRAEGAEDRGATFSFTLPDNGLTTALARHDGRENGFSCSEAAPEDAIPPNGQCLQTPRD